MYVKGDTLYMKIQKPGMFCGWARTLRSQLAGNPSLFPLS